MKNDKKAKDQERLLVVPGDHLEPAAPRRLSQTSNSHVPAKETISFRGEFHSGR